jgi:type II secretory pathway component PulC
MNMNVVEEIILPFIATEKGQRLGFGLVLLFGFVFLYTSIYTVIDWRADYVLAHRDVAIHEAPRVDGDAQLIAALPSLHLFGQAAEDSGFLPITSLQLHLTGIAKSSETNLSRAIISEAGQPGKVYVVGDVLVSGIRIYAINDEGVVLEHAGRLEKLPLARAPLLFKDSPQSLWPTERG